MSGIKDVDSWRKFHLSVAEWVDAWRLIPRAVVALFGYGVFGVTKWYMSLEPYLLEGCVEAGGKVAECLIQAPTTQHTALVSAMFALAAAVFAFYSNNGRKWNGFSHWNNPERNDNPYNNSMNWRKDGDNPPGQPPPQARSVMDHDRGNGG